VGTDDASKTAKLESILHILINSYNSFQVLLK